MGSNKDFFRNSRPLQVLTLLQQHCSFFNIIEPFTKKNQLNCSEDELTFDGIIPTAICTLILANIRIMIQILLTP